MTSNFAGTCVFPLLIVMVGGVFAEIFVRGRLAIHGNAAATAHNIQSQKLLYRLGFVVEVLYCACNIPLTLIFCNLFKVVDKNVALMMGLVGLVANATESVSLLAHLAPLVLLGGGHYLSAFTAEQLQAAEYLSVQLFEHGFAICLVFFGFDRFSTAYLIVPSKFFLRLIGVLLAIAGLGYLINNFSLILAPALQARIFPNFTATAIAEVVLCLWLMVIAVDVQRWKEQADAAGRCRS
jgi:hypothetical protein